MKSLKECVRAVCPAMLVVLSWLYVMLTNLNMVSSRAIAGAPVRNE